MGQHTLRGSGARIVTDNLIASDAFERLQDMLAASPAKMVELCREYLAEARQTLAQLRNAYTLKQADRMRNKAHYLKGSSLLLGAIVVTQCCTRLEEMGEKGDWTEAEQMLDQLSVALNAVEQEYVKILGPDVLPARGSAA
jgi:HPt (histidine-containing phosphotransfer) domain-containing protein